MVRNAAPGGSQRAAGGDFRNKITEINTAFRGNGFSRFSFGKEKWNSLLREGASILKRQKNSFLELPPPTKKGNTGF